MSADELSQGVDYDVSSVFDRTNEVWRSESAVYNEWNCIVMCDLSNLVDIDQEFGFPRTSMKIAFVFG